mgnify:CR=1 FL=1
MSRSDLDETDTERQQALQTALNEKETVTQLNKKINFQEKDFNESQLDYFYLTSPSMIEKRIKNLDINRYLPMEYSKIFLSISYFNSLQNKYVSQD